MVPVLHFRHDWKFGPTGFRSKNQTEFPVVQPYELSIGVTWFAGHLAVLHCVFSLFAQDEVYFVAELDKRASPGSTGLQMVNLNAQQDRPTPTHPDRTGLPI